MKELAEHLYTLGEEGQSVLISAHPHADPDAVGSVLALANLLEYFGADVRTGIPDNISKVARNVLDYFDRKINVDPDIETDCVIILDTSSLGQLEGLGDKVRESGKEVVFIDHHRPEEKTRDSADVFYAEESATSAAELVLKLAEMVGYRFDSEISQLLLVGIISDTGHFKFANGDTFGAVSKLIDWGASYRESLQALETPEDPSKRIAMLKAAKRTEIYKRHGRWIAFSRIGAYESDAASMLLSIGAEISMVANEEEGKIRASARSRSGLASETGLHLGKLLSDLAEEYGGTGGGHAGAAGMKAEGNWDEMKEDVLVGMEKMLKAEDE